MAAIAVYHVVVLPSVFVLGPVLAEREWGGAASWSTVTAGFGIGSIAGDLCAYRLKVPRPMVLAAAGLAVASCQAIIIGSGASIVLITILEAVTGVGVSLFFVLWETALQTHVPEAALSRVSSYDYLLSAGLMPLGLVLGKPGIRRARRATHALRHDGPRGSRCPRAALGPSRTTPPGPRHGPGERQRPRRLGGKPAVRAVSRAARCRGASHSRRKRPGVRRITAPTTPGGSTRTTRPCGATRACGR